ncbi:MAG: hypothetical protein NTV51_25505 [Verrucomicrobia bacterium]|nr:hypothetical protein [Verrucomicrobiota bacterium]
MPLLVAVRLSAQVTAISNTGQTYVTALATGKLTSGEGAHAFSFTTGATDWTFSGITLSINGSGPSSQGFSVSLYSGMGVSGPTGLETALSGNTAPRPAGAYSYTPVAQTGLLANTTYWVVTMAPTSPLNQPIAVNATSSTAEDAGGFAGWSIGDQRFYSTNGGISWTAASSGLVPQFSVQVAAIPEIPTGALVAGLAAFAVSGWRRVSKHRSRARV